MEIDIFSSFLGYCSTLRDCEVKIMKNMFEDCNLSNVLKSMKVSEGTSIDQNIFAALGHPIETSDRNSNKFVV